MNLLTLALIVPLLGAVVAYTTRSHERARWVALTASLPPLGVGIYGLTRLWSEGGPVLETTVPWIQSFGIHWALAFDGFGGPLFTLTALLVTVSIIYSWNEDRHGHVFHAMLLLLNTAVMGVFVARDLFLFYVFWEAVLIPMFFLVAIWGGPARRYAAIKFFLYTFGASLFMLLAFMGLYFGSGAESFLFTDVQAGIAGMTRLPQLLIFLGLLIGFAVKLPSVPFHTWLPWAHVEAPTAGSMLLAGVLLKMGGYGLIAIALPLLPDAALFFAPLMLTLGIVSILYGAFVSLAQDDLKKMVALSSVSHMGFVMVGAASFTTAGLNGALYMMLAHGLLSPFAFLVAGSVDHAAGTRRISQLGGLAQRTPKLAFYASAAFLGSLGLPGLAGFVAEFQVFVGIWQRWGWMLMAAIVSVVITAMYYIWAIERSFHGPLNPRHDHAHDLPRYEALAALVLLILSIAYGVWPPLLTHLTTPQVDGLLQAMGV